MNYLSSVFILLLWLGFSCSPKTSVLETIEEVCPELNGLYDTQCPSSWVFDDTTATFITPNAVRYKFRGDQVDTTNIIAIQVFKADFVEDCLFDYYPWKYIAVMEDGTSDINNVSGLPIRVRLTSDLILKFDLPVGKFAEYRLRRVEEGDP